MARPKILRGKPLSNCLGDFRRQLWSWKGQQEWNNPFGFIRSHVAKRRTQALPLSAFLDIIREYHATNPSSRRTLAYELAMAEREYLRGQLAWLRSYSRVPKRKEKELLIKIEQAGRAVPASENRI